MEQICQRLTAQLEEDLRTIQLMLKEQPSLLRKLTDGTDLSSISPQNTLELLSRSIQKDFPALG